MKIIQQVVLEKEGGQQRCLWMPSSDINEKPPIVLLGGMAQSIAAWEHQHLPALHDATTATGGRSVLLYEARGQGPPSSSSSSDYTNVSLPAQASYLMETIDKVIGFTTTTTTTSSPKVDLVGFSLGGRIAMATALLYPDRIRSLHLTGVAAERSILGRLTVASWKDHVSRDSSLTSFAWSVLLATYSSATLDRLQHDGKLQSILDFIARQNTPEGLLALLEQTHTDSTSSSLSAGDDEWSTVAMARRICALQPPLSGNLCVGRFDQDMAPLKEVERLTHILGWKSPYIIEGCGHAVPMEQPRLWRKHLLECLEEQEVAE